MKGMKIRLEWVSLKQALKTAKSVSNFSKIETKVSQPI
jgi:hypothetical protein